MRHPGLHLTASSPGPRAAREQLGLDADRRVVFTAHRLVARMGLDVLLEARQRLERCSNELPLIAGEGPDHDGLAPLIDTAGPHGSVQLPGMISETTWSRTTEPQTCASCLRSHWRASGRPR